MTPRPGALNGVRVVELEAHGPTPFCGMMLSDMGAEVIRIVRTTRSEEVATLAPELDPLLRGRTSVRLNLKDGEGRDAALALIERADVLIEGYRPGVMERLGLGPEQAHVRNPRLIYGRVTGWGQTGPWARAAGHDINFIGATGVLHAIGPEQGDPAIPLNLVGDFGGGGMLAAFGLVCALLEARSSGAGQVVDVAMIDGSALLIAQQMGFLSDGSWIERRQSNILDGGAPWYGAYLCADGRHIAVGAFEEPFWRNLLQGLGLDVAGLPDRAPRTNWQSLRKQIAAVFLTKSLAEWLKHFEQFDACVSPVLTIAEAVELPHIAARGTVCKDAGRYYPAPAPRFSATPASIQPSVSVDSAESILHRWQTGDAAPA